MLLTDNAVPTQVLVPSKSLASEIDFQRLRLQGLAAENMIDIQAAKISLSNKNKDCEFLSVEQILQVLRGKGDITKNWWDVVKNGGTLIAFGQKVQLAAAPGIFYKAIVYYKKVKGDLKIITLSSRGLVKDGYVTPLITK